MKNRVGPPVRGEDCFGRDAFVDLLWRKVEAGHVLLAAPRRFGKTSVMYRLIDEPRGGFAVVHVDLEHLEEPAQLLSELLTKLARVSGLALNWDAFGEKFKGIAAGARKILSDTVSEVELANFKIALREQTGMHWQEIGDQLFAQLAATKRPVLFVLDEFPMMLDRMARSPKQRDEAIILLRWLRRLRVAPEMSAIHFLVAGSIGIDAVVNDLGEAKSINDFERLRLTSFSTPQAKQFLQALGEAHGVVLSPKARTTILQLIGEPVPYFLQILFSEVAKTYPGGQGATPTKIEEIYHRQVLGMDCKSYFEHYYGRLRDYYKPEEERVIKRLLRELAFAQKLSRSEAARIYREEMGNFEIESFNALMTNLEYDFYVQQEAQTLDYLFSCSLLRDWWLRYYGPL